jgi:predicted CXXCH cytochrome family protein
LAVAAALLVPRWYAWLTGVSGADDSHATHAAPSPPQSRSPADVPQTQLAPAVFPPPPLSASSYLNTAGQASYVGIAACAECHADENRSFRQTAHSLALSDVIPAAEPPDAHFFHAPSGRTYSIYRKGAQLRHREAVRDEQGNEYAAADYPIRYLVGSGRHTRSYLVDVEGFLSESPITWYASRKSWSMSPGYDRPNHKGFERAADATCMICHAGQISSPDQDYQRLTFPEQSIGCERCHGPGSLHVEERRALGSDPPRPPGAQQPADTQPRTIVNPARLTRARSEAICAQCHLMGDSLVTVRGRGIADFRPGLPLTDFCINYRLDEPNSRMKVVGHVDQLHLSACYLKSDKLTCTTCHDPHSAARPEGNRERYLQVCLSCHTAASCRLDAAQRVERNAAADCVTCHMPQVDTEIPHIAFTHHRIGLHSSDAEHKASPQRLGQFADLIPLDDISQLSAIERDRNLGMAYFGLSQHQADPAASAYRERARRLLESVRSQGLSDGDVVASLARLYYSRGDAEAAYRLAGETLTIEKLSPKSRVNALFYIGELGVRSNRFGPAEQALGQLIALRRLSEDWLLLGVCRQRGGDLPGALRDLQQATRIAPFRPEIREDLAQIYQWLGDAAAAERERSIARRLAVQNGAKQPLNN